MANSDKDILITPNTGQSAKPKIEVTGANNATKTITINDDGTISFDSTIEATSGSVADGNTNLVTGDAVFDYIAAQSFGDITAVTAGTGLSGGGTSGAVTLTNAGVTSIVAGSNISIDSSTGAVTITSTDTNTQLSTEQVQDIVGAMFSSNTETRISATYQDGDGTIDLVVDDMTANTQLTTEEVQDIVGAMFTSNTETRISATYEDGDGTIDLVVDDMTADTNTFRTVTAGGNTLGGSETLAFTAGSNVTITESGGAVTIASTDTNTQLTLLDEDNMSSNSATAAASQQSIKAYVDSEVAGIVDSAPSALNTLNELAAALGDDASFSTTTATSLGNRLRVDVSNQGLTSTQQGNALTNLGITASLAEINILDDGLAASDIPNLATSKITSGTFADARIAESNVTQHQAALSITESQISDLQSYLTAPRTVTAGGNTLANGETLAFTAGSNITISESGGAVTITAAASSGASEAFKTIAVSGQDDVVADSATDTLTFAAGSNVTLTTNASSDTVTIAATDTNTQLSTEQVQDIVGAMFSSNTETRVSATYEDGDGTIDLVVDDMTRRTITAGGNTLADGETLAFTAGSNVTISESGGAVTIASTDTNTQLSTEQVQDIVGAMFSSNTETRISATYQDGDGTIDLVVDDMTTDTNTNQLTTFTLTGDSGSNQTIAHGNTLDIAGGDGIATVVGSTDTVTVGLDIDGMTDIGAALADADLMIVDDGAGGTNRKATMSRLKTYMQNGLTFTTDTNLTTEEVQDIVGAMVSGNTETNIAVTYDDTNGKLNFASTDTNTQLTLLDQDDMSSNSATAAASQQSIKAYVDAEVAGIVDSAPSALNTLNELAAALGDDASFSTTTATSLGNRLRIDVSNQGLTGTQKSNALTNLGITASLAEINILDDGLSASDIPNLATSKITSGTFDDGRIAQSNVTQHLAVGSGGGIGLSGKTFSLDIDGMTDIGAALVDADLMIVDDGAGGTNRKATMSRLKTYMQNNLTFTTNTDTQLSNEQVQDIAGGMFSSNTETLITATYQDGDGTIDLVVDNDLSNYDNSSSGFITATLTTEQVQDIVGAMFSSNTETRISATYQDGDGTIDLVADDMNFSVSDITGATALTSGLASTDELVLSDAGTLKRMDVSVLQDYMQNNLSLGTVGGSDTEILYNDGGTENGIASLTWTDTSGSEQLKLTDESDTALFKIEQTGTGNVFEAHDQASDSNIFKIDNAGKTVIGTTSSSTAHSAFFLYVNGDTRLSRLRVGTGSNSEPGVHFEGDSDTGIRRTAADQLGFITGGSERLSVGSAGEILIGGSAAGNSGQVLTSGGSGAAVTWEDAGGSPGGSDTFIQYNNGGSFGATTLSFDDTDGSEQFLFDDTSDTALVKIVQRGTGSAFEVHDQASDSSIFKINHVGQVSIKTSTPIAGGLTINDDMYVGQIKNSAAGSASSPRYTFYSDSNTGMYSGGADILKFSTGGTERVKLSSSGLQLGAANAEVTTILDEDDMSTNSDTALATQQSIKAYVDNNAGGASALGDLSDATTGTSGSNNIGIGSNALDAQQAGGNGNIGLGENALTDLTTGDYNIALGSSALPNVIGGGNNIGIGRIAGFNLTSGERNIAIGYGTLQGADTESDNVAIGYAALGATTASEHNVVIGNYAGDAITSGNQNTFLGHQSGTSITTAQYSVAVGYRSLYNTDTGSRNTAVGYLSMEGAANNSADQNAAFGGYSLKNVQDGATGNTGLGYLSLSAVTTGDKNIAIGYESGDNITTGSNNVVIGAADVDTATGDDQISISGSDGGVTWLKGDSNGIKALKIKVKSVSSNTTLTDAQSGSYVYWTAGTLTLPATAESGQQYTIINNTGGSATPSLGTSNAIASGWTSHAAMADETARTYVSVATNKWIYIG